MGVKLDGIDPQKEWGLIFLRDHYHPATPEIRNRSMSIPGMPGEWDFGSEWGSRPFSLPFGLIDYDRYKLQSKLRAFMSFLVDYNGRPRTVKLSFDYEPEKYYEVKMNGRVDPERAFFTGQFSLPLLAYNPFAFAELGAFNNSKPLLYDSTVEFDSGSYYDNEASFQWIYPKHYSGIYNYSKMATPLGFTLNGTVTNPKITNQRHGSSITLPSLNNQLLIVDAEKFTVKRNGVNILSEYSGEFLKIIQGENSILFEGDNPNCTVTFNWRHKFL